MREMIDLFESIPFSATTAIAATISVAVVAALSRVIPIRAMWAAALVVPFMVAYFLYWAPTWVRHDTDTVEYSAWQFLFLFVWGIAGVVSSLAFVAFLAKRHAGKSRPTA
jgi:predicted membrane protein